MVQPRKTGNCPDMAEIFLTGTYSIKTNKTNAPCQDPRTVKYVTEVISDFEPFDGFLHLYIVLCTYKICQ